jgi:hypothetical protein
MGEMEKPVRSEQAQQHLDAAITPPKRLVDREIPWWYHVGMALSLGIAISSFSMGKGYPSFLMPGGILVAPFALSWLLNNRTGIELSSFRPTPGAVAPGWKWAGTVTLTVMAGTALQWGFELRWAMAASGVAVFALTLVYSRRVTAAIVNDLRPEKSDVGNLR